MSVFDHEKGATTPATKPTPCGDYQAVDEKGSLVPLPDLVAILCPFCFVVLMRGWNATNCDFCGDRRSVLIEKSKLKVIA
jgi:hypothetical protein